MAGDRVRVGVMGCGGFGLFALQQFTKVPGVELVAMTGSHSSSAATAMAQFGVENDADTDAFLGREELDLIYIATPPFLHHSQSIEALHAGKHVIVEKPLALTPSQADEMIAIAGAKNLLLVANLMQRYNPLFETVRRLIRSNLLGEVLHGFFENYAADENLPNDHWFWEPSRSGGIFIEHGVHFFDLIEGWLGAGKVVSALGVTRPGTQIEDQVQCTVEHDRAILVNHYHGFQHAARMDRQELRIVFERGDLSLFDWVPTGGRIRAVVDEKQKAGLLDLFPDARVKVATQFGDEARAFRSHGKDHSASEIIEISFGENRQKMDLYAELLRLFMADQVAWIRDRTHSRVVTEQNGRDSLVVAFEAERLARSAVLD